MNKKALIFDDDEDIQIICTYIFEENGWEVLTVSDCANVIEIVEKFMPDIIFMDNWIPQLGGVISTQILKKQEHLKHIPIIFFSANLDVKNLSIQAGADSFLGKPFDLEEIINIIDSVKSKII